MGLLNSKLYINDIKKALEKYDFSLFNGKSFLVTGAVGLICSSLIDVLLVLQEITGIKIKIWGAGRNPHEIEKRFEESCGFVDFAVYLFVFLWIYRNRRYANQA